MLERWGKVGQSPGSHGREELQLSSHRRSRGNNLQSALLIHGLCTQIQPTTDRKYFKKNSRKFPKAKLGFAHANNYIPSIYIVFYNYLHNIYIVLGIISHLEMAFSFFSFLGRWHMEAPRLGVKSDGAADAGLRQSHSNTGSDLSLQPTLQLAAAPDP